MNVTAIKDIACGTVDKNVSSGPDARCLGPDDMFLSTYNTVKSSYQFSVMKYMESYVYYMPMLPKFSHKIIINQYNNG